MKKQTRTATTGAAMPADATLEAYESLGSRVAELMAENEQLKAEIAAIKAASASAALLQFSAEAEALRPFFEREADALRALIALEREHSVKIDVDGPREGDFSILSDSIGAHLLALTDVADFASDIAMRRFYVPLRLQIAEQEFERKREAEKART